MIPTVGFLLDRPPSAASVLPDVFRHLRRAGARVITWAGGDSAPAPEEIGSAHVLALRQPGPAGLALARRLEAGGARCCNSPQATSRASDKGSVLVALAGFAVPVPAGVVVASWAEVRETTGRRPAVVKAVRGRGGTGVLLADGRGLPDTAPFPGPFLVQERLPHDGPDRKVFVIGSRSWGVLRGWPATAPAEKHGRPFTPTAAESDIALCAGRALGLEVYGVDFVTTEDGPVVVDVNAFPGFKGVDGAAAALARHLLALAAPERSR